MTVLYLVACGLTFAGALAYWLDGCDFIEFEDVFVGTIWALFVAFLTPLVWFACIITGFVFLTRWVFRKIFPL
mgnify:CR=1 FL=1